MKPSQKWRPVPGFPGYEISRDGTVRSWRGMGRNPKRPQEPKIMTPRLQHGGLYIRVRRDRRYHQLSVNRAIFEAWGINQWILHGTAEKGRKKGRVPA